MSIDNNYRLLSSLHGPPEPDLPHLRPTDQPRLRSNLPWTASYLRYPDRRLLAHRAGPPRNGRAIAGRSWRIWLPCNLGRLVDLLCSNARFRRLPIPTSGGRHQSLDHAFERACQAKGTLSRLITLLAFSAQWSACGLSSEWRWTAQVVWVLILGN